MIKLLFFFLLVTLIYMLFKVTVWVWKITLGVLTFIILVLFLFSLPVFAYEYTPNDIVLIGKVAQHEAGNQSELGQRLVIDTILNRVDSDKFPNTPNDVINQPGQYCNPSEYPPEEIYMTVAEEIYVKRTNDQVLYFKTGGYHSFAIPVVKEGNHYFSGR